ncbi:hypothetical protein DPMN_079284 [Dreissena polymorpha]|uniref:Uncharacterized protein n=1 Tax=Dreissena polymorpha TaxID=45954 RepID=A0A9D3YRZ7_DREPO|nr:hypothetical protein DPMN_079284 [Dreissena polymorpha]
MFQMISTNRQRSSRKQTTMMRNPNCLCSRHMCRPKKPKLLSSPNPQQGKHQHRIRPQLRFRWVKPQK